MARKKQIEPAEPAETELTPARAAMFGVAQKTIEGICWANSRRKLEECDG